MLGHGCLNTENLLCFGAVRIAFAGAVVVQSCAMLGSARKV